MSQAWTREQISHALNVGADLVLDELLQGESSRTIAARSLVDIVVHAQMAALEHPDWDLDEIIQHGWETDPEEVKGWTSDIN